MPTMNNDPHTIDLTLDDDTPPPASRPPTETPDFFMPSPSPVPTQSTWHRSRAPPFNGPGSAAQPVVLADPSDEDDAPHEARRTHAVHIRSPSPEVEFVRARPAQANFRLPEPPAYPPSAREPYQVPQQPAGMALGGIHDFMRRTTQYFGNFPNQILPNLGLPILGNLTPAEDDALEILEGPDVFDDVHLDYGQAAFRMRDRESEAPQAAQDDYKPPPEPLDGCLRTYEEESILVCPCCGEELCTGEGELKQQVWVNKTCGHVSFQPWLCLFPLTVIGLLRRMCKQQSTLQARQQTRHTTSQPSQGSRLQVLQSGRMQESGDQQE
jgi:hypothetical protein